MNDKPKKASTPYYALFTMRDLFVNPDMAKALPQFSRMLHQNIFSYRETEKRVTDYIKGLFNAQESEGGLIIRGKHEAVLKRLQSMAGQIEAFFNAMPHVVKNLYSNAKLYLPYVSLSQMSELKTRPQREKLLKLVLENLQYNPDLNSTGKLPNNKKTTLSQQQKAWQKKVGYKE